MGGRGPKSLGKDWTHGGYAFLKGKVMVWASSWALGPFLRLFLSPNTIIKGNSTFLARIGPAPEHRGHGPFLGGPGAKELTLLRDELMLLALPQGLGQKLSFFLGAKVVGL